MKSALALWRCSHPGPTVVVTTFAGLLAVGAGRGAGATWVAAAVLAGQLSVGWSNDWVDRGRDRAVRRRDKPLVAGDVADATVMRAALVAAALCVPLSLASGLAAAVAHLLAVAAAWSYNLGVKATPFSVVPYAVAFGLLPAFVTLGPPLHAAPPAWAVAAGALLGAGAHFANTLPDLADDAATHVRGLPHRLGARRSGLAAALLLGGGALSVGVGARPGLSPPAIVALAVALVAASMAVPAARRGDRAAFRLAMTAAACVVVAFLAVGLG